MTERNTRPVFSRLPIRGYQDNSTVDALTDYLDERIYKAGLQIENLYKKLDPTTTDPEYLDWVAFLVGMVEPYYSLGWSPTVKRQAITQANEIFRCRGTPKGLELALSIHGFSYSLYVSNDLILPFTFDSNTKFGLVSQTAYVRLPLEYGRSSYAFREAERAVKNYTAVVTPTKVCYDRFYLGFSVFGDPLF